MDELHPLVEHLLKQERELLRETRQKGELPRFSEGYYVLMTRDDFHRGEKLCLRWSGP